MNINNEIKRLINLQDADSATFKNAIEETLENVARVYFQKGLDKGKTPRPEMYEDDKYKIGAK
jgi:hypothetical protein